MRAARRGHTRDMMLRVRVIALTAAVGLLAMACAQGSTDPRAGVGFVAGTGGASSSVSSGGFLGLGPFHGGGGEGGATWAGLPWDDAACSEPTQFVYVVTTTSDLYRFWPPTLSFELVGHLDCPTAWSPLSMAVDRHATAWILYWDQVVYRLDLATGHCIESGYNAEHVIPGPFGYFGMAFAADASAVDEETLFVRQVAFFDQGADPGERTLGRFDTGTAAISAVGVGLGGNADLAGTGDGRLHGFEKVSNAQGDGLSRLVEYDPATGARIATTDLDGLTIGDAWAVAAWGGDLWLFSSTYEGSTRVVRYAPATEALEVVVPDAGFEVIGAGVSSCAPIVPPK
jgi:hypothetical protein